MHAKLLSPVALLLVVLACACGGRGGGSDAPVAMGQLEVSWSTAVLGQAVPCARVGALGVVARLHPQSGDDLRFAFTCTDGSGASSPITAGAYEVTISLVGADGLPFADAPTQQVVVAAGRATTIPAAMFDFADGTGHVALSLTALGVASQCTAQPGGAGITAHTLTLLDADGDCVPATFTRRRNGKPNGTYTINCTAPVAGPCIDHDETLTADGLTAGPYLITVTGQTNAPTLCWRGQDVLSIPASGTLTKTVQLALARDKRC